MTGGTWTLSTTFEGVTVTQYASAPAAVSAINRDSSALALVYGTGSGTIDLEVPVIVQLAAGASTTLNLNDGSLVDQGNVAAKMQRLRGARIRVSGGGDAAGVTIGNAASNACPLFFGGTTPTWTIFPGGPPLDGGSAAGIAVTSTTCNVKIVNNGAVPATVLCFFGGHSQVAGGAMGCLGLTYP